MKVLHVIPGLGAGGGAERSVAGTAAALTGTFVELHLAVLTDRRSLVGAVEEAGAVVHDLSTPRGTLRRAIALRRLIREVDPDIVHASLFDADVVAQLAVGRSRPLIVTWAGTPYSRELRGRRGITWWKVQAVRVVEMVLGAYSRPWYQAVTEGVAVDNATALHVPRERVIVCERGRPAAPLREPMRRSNARSALGLHGDRPMVLCIARHEPEKGLDDLIEAFGRLLGEVPAARLFVAGREGSLTSELRATLQRQGLAGRVELLGHRDDIDDLLVASDLFVSASVSEGAAGGVLEAMSAGLPIVATATTGMRGVLTGDSDGLVVAVGDTEALYRAMLGLLRDPDRAAALGTAANQSFDQRFTEDRSAAALLAMYRRVAPGSGVEGRSR